MQVVRTVAQMRAALPDDAGATIGLVPTMGALHAGHIALVRAARAECTCVVASVFVNPAQFNDAADLTAYPRDEAGDLALAADAGVDYVFAPDASELYRDGHATWVEPSGAADGFEGDLRPGHFRGVATVVLKLFLIVRPDVVYFGQKDAQQVAVVEQLVRDLNVDVEIRVIPTIRDHDGVALSSRNARLSTPDRARAAALPRALDAGTTAHRAGRDPVAAARMLLAGLDVDYVEVADWNGRKTLVVAVRLGGTRLIDNVRLE